MDAAGALELFEELEANDAPVEEESEDDDGEKSDALFSDGNLPSSDEEDRLNDDLVFGEFLENGSSSDEDKNSHDELQEAVGRGQAQPVRGRAPLALRGGIARGAGRAQPADGTADRGVHGACGGGRGGGRGRGSGFGVLSGVVGDQDVLGPAQYPDLL